MTTPTFRPPPGGFDDALRRTARRRARRRIVTASLAAGGATVAVVATLAVAGGAVLTDSLQQDQPAGPGPGRSESAPSPSDRNASPSPTRTGVTAPEASPDPATVVAAGRREQTAQQHASDSARQRQTSAAGTVISTALVRGDATYDNTSPCADSSGRAATGWCMQFPGPYVGSGGKPTTLHLNMCRLPGFPDATATFPTSNEADLSLSATDQARTQLWSYASQHPAVTSRHQLTVLSGHCLAWSVTWTNRDDAGRPIPTGDYTLSVAVNADNIPNPNQVSNQVYDYRET